MRRTKVVATFLCLVASCVVASAAEAQDICRGCGAYSGRIACTIIPGSIGGWCQIVCEGGTCVCQVIDGDCGGFAIEGAQPLGGNGWTSPRLIVARLFAINPSLTGMTLRRNQVRILDGYPMREGREDITAAIAREIGVRLEDLTPTTLVTGLGGPVALHPVGTIAREGYALGVKPSGHGIAVTTAEVVDGMPVGAPVETAIRGGELLLRYVNIGGAGHLLAISVAGGEGLQNEQELRSLQRDAILQMNDLTEHRVSQGSMALLQNQPNPFASTTVIGFDLVSSARIRLDVFDLLGRRVKVLADGSFAAGYHSVEWDRRDGAGKSVHPGIYMYRLTSGDRRSEKSMVVLP